MQPKHLIILTLLALRLPIAAEELKRSPAKLYHRPFRVTSVAHKGFQVFYQEGAVGANWTSLSPGGFEASGREVQLRFAPALILSASGTIRVGANASLKVPALGLSFTHLPHLGQTRGELKLARPVSLRAIHRRGRTRVGPAIELGEGVKLWYGRAVGQGTDLILMTGSFSF